MITYHLYDPNDPTNRGCLFGTIVNGKAFWPDELRIDPTDRPYPELDRIIDQIRRGVGSIRAEAIYCCPNNKSEGTVTLGELLGVNKKQKRAKTIHIRSAANLRSISKENRYKGKFDWEALRPKISELEDEGLSVSKIATNLGVSRTALRAANERLNLLGVNT
jgi:hypothetical protein